jgi:Domain of unknown function (DUF6915)
MAHPLKHAESSASKFGGKAEDYLPIHNWFDESTAFSGLPSPSLAAPCRYTEYGITAFMPSEELCRARQNLRVPKSMPAHFYRDPLQVNWIFRVLGTRHNFEGSSMRHSRPEDFSWKDFLEIQEPFRDTDAVRSAPTLNGWHTGCMSKDTVGIKLCGTFSR